jgi:hypothetical protein
MASNCSQVTTNCPLPIDLIEFNGKTAGNKNELYWSTATEINNDHFELERSINGEEFSIIGRIPGAGNSNQLINYLFTDDDPPTSAYYRLKQTDFDGTFSYSDLVFINRSNIGSLGDISIWPNPSEGSFYVSFNAISNGSVPYQVTDISGRIVLDDIWNINEGDNTFIIELGKLKQGIYYLGISLDDEKIIHKLLRY